MCSNDVSGPLQVLETRAELDSLEEIAKCPMVAMRIARYSAFLTAAPQILQSTRSVAEFEARLMGLLFPEAPYLDCLAQTPNATSTALP